MTKFLWSHLCVNIVNKLWPLKIIITYFFFCYIEQIWEQMLARTSLENLLPAVCPMIASWLCLMMANPKVPLEPTLLLIAHHNKVRYLVFLLCRYIKVYCSRETHWLVHTLCICGCHIHASQPPVSISSLQ